MSHLAPLGLPLLWLTCCAVAAWQGRVLLWAVFALPPTALAIVAWIHAKFFETAPDEFGVKNVLELAVIFAGIVVPLTGLGLHLRRKSVSGTRPPQGI